MATQHVAVVKIDVHSAREHQIELAVNTFLSAGYRLENVVPAGSVVAFLFLGDESARNAMIGLQSAGQDAAQSVVIQTQPRHSGQAPGAGPTFTAGPSELDQMLASGRAHVNNEGRVVQGPFVG